jgi:hypothetical protein
MTQNAHLNYFRITASSNDTKQHSVGCECVHIIVNSRQIAVEHTTGVRRELSHQFITAHTWNPVWPTHTFLCTLREIEHHDVVMSAIFHDEFPDKHPCE